MRLIDWSEAPEWADRVGGVGSWGSIVWANSEKYCYVGEINNIYYFDGPGTWNIEALIDVKYRHTPWQGPKDGLPPVGYTQDDCAMVHLDESDKFTVVAHHYGHAIVAFGPGPKEGTVMSTVAKADEFRAIPSERDKLADELHIEISGEPIIGDETDDADRVSWCYGAVDAGWRKPERKPMSRYAAGRLLSEKFDLNSVAYFDSINSVLDALGYKEPSQ